LLKFFVKLLAETREDRSDIQFGKKYWCHAKEGWEGEW